MCDPSAPVPAIPGRKSKAHKARQTSRTAPRPVSPRTATVSPPAPAQRATCRDCGKVQADGEAFRIGTGGFQCRACEERTAEAVRATRPDIYGPRPVSAPVLAPLPAALAYSVKAAKFASKCPDCRQPILPGQMIRVPKTQGNGYSRHDVCAPAPVAAPVPVAVPPGPQPFVVRAVAAATAAVAPVPVQSFPKTATPAWSRPDWRGALAAQRPPEPTPAELAEEKTQVDPLRQPLTKGDWKGLFERHAAGLVTQAEAEQIAATWKGGATA